MSRRALLNYTLNFPLYIGVILFLGIILSLFLHFCFGYSLKLSFFNGIIVAYFFIAMFFIVGACKFKILIPCVVIICIPMLLIPSSILFLLHLSFIISAALIIISVALVTIYMKKQDWL